MLFIGLIMFLAIQVVSMFISFAMVAVIVILPMGFFRFVPMHHFFEGGYYKFQN